MDGGALVGVGSFSLYKSFWSDGEKHNCLLQMSRRLGYKPYALFKDSNVQNIFSTFFILKKISLLIVK
jgi:hypothetical protein